MNSQKLIFTPFVFQFLLFAFCFLPFAICQSTMAQTPILLKAAIDTALKNNLQIKKEKLSTEYLEKLKNTSYNIPQTNVTFDYGHINSAYIDNKFSVTQTIKFPSVYAHQKSIINEEIKGASLSVSLKENEIKRQVTQRFYMFLYLKQKQKLLHEVDSIYALFLERATIRFKVGETNILERITAETQRGQVNQQLQQLKQDEEIVLLQFKLLLNTIANVVPFETNFKLESATFNDSASVFKHPYIKILQQQQRLSQQKMMLEKTKFSPDLFATYSNGTFKGIGADNQLYTLANRFQSFQVGVGIPLFFGSQKAQFNASKLSMTIAKNDYILGTQLLYAEYQQALHELAKCKKSVAYYENAALKNAEIIIETANAQFKNGDINYLEWVLLINNSITIKSEYVDATKNLNDCIIKLNSITNN